MLFNIIAKLRSCLFLGIILTPSCANENNEVERKLIFHCDGKSVDTIYSMKIFNEFDKLIEVRDMLNDTRQGILNEYDSNGNIKNLKTFLSDTLFGDFEEYFSNGKLKKYQFIVKSGISSFFRFYNDKGKCIDCKGSPLCFKLIGTNKKKDSLDIKFVFADKIFDTLTSLVSVDGIVYHSINFEKCDDEFPFNKVYRHVQSIIGKKNISIYFETRCLDKYTKEKLYYCDTVNLINKNI